jgi:hypothetical protein
MKAYILIAAALAAFSSPAGAAGVTGGLKTGLNISTFVGDDVAASGDTKISRAGLIAGGYLIFPVRNAPFSIQAEAMITSKGAIYKWGVLGIPYETTYKLTYLEIPVLARFDFESRGGARPALLIGPAFGIKISARGESRTIGASERGNLKNIRGLDPGIAVGGVIDMETSKGFVTLEARYTRSLTTISESNNGVSADIKNSVASVMLGYRF